MIYKYKVSRKALMKAKLIIFISLLFVGIIIFIVAAVSSSDYSFIGYLVGAICFIIGFISLSSCLKIKKQPRRGVETYIKQKNEIDMDFVNKLLKAREDRKKQEGDE